MDTHRVHSHPGVLARSFVYFSIHGAEGATNPFLVTLSKVIACEGNYAKQQSKLIGAVRSCEGEMGWKLATFCLFG